MRRRAPRYAARMSDDDERVLLADVGGTHVRFALADPGAVVYDLRTQNQSGPAGKTLEVRSLSVALPKLPVYHLTFDAKTDALLRVEYTVQELGRPYHKQWVMSDHKAGPEGLLLPTKMQYRLDNVAVEEWEAEKWEFPASIPDDEFSPPQKK